MDLIVNKVLNLINPRFEEDIIDRLNYQFTAIIFCISSILIMSKQYTGKPIICWTPAEFRGGWNEYARDYCLIENTYYVPFEAPDVPTIDDREHHKLPYYQWVQFVLALLAFAFFLPHFFWRSLNWQSGLQVRAIVKECVEKVRRAPNLEEREKALDKIAQHLDKSITAQAQIRPAYKSNPIIYLLTHFFTHKFVTAMYLTMKLFFLVNIIFQLFVLTTFLGHGIGDLAALAKDLSYNTAAWKQTGLFPRSTMCDFEVRVMGNIQRYTVQCVLSLNLFNEKIFAVLSIWLMVLFVITFINTAWKAIQLLDSSSRQKFVNTMLKASNVSIDMKDESQLALLTRSSGSNASNKSATLGVISADVVLVLRLVSSNAGDLICSDLVERLYTLARDRKTGVPSPTAGVRHD